MHAALVKTQLRGLLKWKGSWENTFPYNFKGILVLLLGFVTLATRVTIESVQFSRSVVSDFLRPPELQHARPPSPSPTPRVHSNSRPSSRWCHPAISSSVIPFSSCPQSPTASESFWMSQLFTWGGLSTGVSALASFPPKKIPGQISFRMVWLDLLAVQGTLKNLLQHHSSKASILQHSDFFIVQLSIQTRLLEKPLPWLDGPLLTK